MTEDGVKPRQVLKALKRSNPELQSTPRHLYNLKAKIRQGGLSNRSFKLWRPDRSVPVNPSASSTGESLKKDKQPMKVPNFIGGKFIVSQGCTIIDVLNPATQEVVSHLPLVTYEEFKDAVIAAKRAFPSWKNTPIATRQQIMFRFQELIRRDMDKLATSITSVQGKTLKGAWGDVLCGLGWFGNYTSPAQRTVQRIIETAGDNDALLFEGLNVNDEIQKVLSKYEELKTPSVVPAVPEPALIPVAVEPDSPIHAKEDALIRKPAGQQGGTPGGSNDDLMDDLDEMIFGKKGGSASEGAQDPKKDQLSKDDLITF